ncbi:MAG: hypothetical protein K8E24_014495, partial [Methanobacterium paludis]|nr:hypothetical protein [Methanobacterium paludis]
VVPPSEVVSVSVVSFHEPVVAAAVPPWVYPLVVPVSEFLVAVAPWIDQVFNNDNLIIDLSIKRRIE